MISDGECQEGTTWESLLIGAKNQLDNLVVLIDYNKIQSYGFTQEVVDLEPLNNKWKSFGFDVSEVNGHNIGQLRRNIIQFNKKKINKPTVTICHTIKGKGFYFAENNPNWHHKNNFTKKEINDLSRCLR